MHACMNVYRYSNSYSYRKIAESHSRAVVTQARKQSAGTSGAADDAMKMHALQDELIRPEYANFKVGHVHFRRGDGWKAPTASRTLRPPSDHRPLSRTPLATHLAPACRGGLIVAPRC